MRWCFRSLRSFFRFCSPLLISRLALGPLEEISRNLDSVTGGSTDIARR